MADLTQRITDYLSGGGLFNPELANHGAVRDLLTDCRAALTEREGESVPQNFMADARFIATCVTGYWPGIEDAIDWSNPDASPILAAAKRVQLWKPDVTPIVVEPEKARGCATAVTGEPHAP